jgi:hypothetical protein
LITAYKGFAFNLPAISPLGIKLPSNKGLLNRPGALSIEPHEFIIIHGDIVDDLRVEGLL